MQIADFTLERYFAKWEFAVKYLLCASDAEPVALGDLLAMADDDSLQRWNSLKLGYTESLGLPALREEIAMLYRGLTADDIITFAGAEEGVFLAMHAMLKPGDHAVVVWPAYQSLHEVARSIGASVTLVALNQRDWSFDVDAVAASMQPNTRLIVTNFPHSPTGAQLSGDQLARLIAIAELHGAHLFSDEVYRFLEHSSRPVPPAAELSDRTLSLGVMSKAFGMPGARIGWIATRDAALRAKMAAFKDYTTICNAGPSEVLSLIGLRRREKIVGDIMTIVQSNLKLLDAFFHRHDKQFRWVRPKAGTVCFPEYLGGNVDDFAARLVEQAGVLLLPASQFGYSGNHFRLGYGRRDMPEALAKLEEFVQTG
ncbi:MAG TPA: aminotransferase class I/II-fold pyridoxal phosphate-dependent enzyme [Gemmatimonadaceae bacterium]|jgi:aspartate/methionine/tyrosine aminotransferase